MQKLTPDEKGELGLLAVSTAVLSLVVLTLFVGVSTQTFAFTHATQLNDSPGTVVFYLSDGKTLSYQNAWTADYVQPDQMRSGGFVIVSYTWLGIISAVNYQAA